MSDFELEHLQEETRILPVGEFLNYINFVLDQIDSVKVSGEISSLSLHSSGVYMTLKDAEDESILECYINPHIYRSLGFPLEAGMTIVISGSPEVFKRRGKLSFRVEGVELAGEGAMLKAYQLLKSQLEAEGLFAQKRPLPKIIQRIGIITSATGAVIGDFRNNIEQRGMQLCIKNVRVEGHLASSQIVKAITELNKSVHNLDCIVLMRGGGSLEDLQAFNQEQVVRALFSSRLPTIAAIGHDRDVPLVCLAADYFTSTPTAAAVLINTQWQILDDEVHQLQDQIISGFQNSIDMYSSQVVSSLRLMQTSFQRCIAQARQFEIVIKNAVSRYQNFVIQSRNVIVQRQQLIFNTFISSIKQVKSLLEQGNIILTHGDPRRQLQLGYSLLRDGSGKLVRSVKQVASGDQLSVEVGDGEVNVEVK